jgi:hypothetical protein
MSVPRCSAATLLREGQTLRPSGVVQRRIAVLLTVGALLALVGCESIQEKCRKEYPADPAAAESCFRAVLQRENELQNQRDREDFRRSGGG